MKRINVRHRQARTSTRHRTNRTRWWLLAFILLAGLAIFRPSVRAASPEQIAARAPVAEINNKKGLAVKGYDVVAYFTDGRPVKGTANNSYQWQGATWQFASPEHRAAFMREPAKYAPQYGGDCASSVAPGGVVGNHPNPRKKMDREIFPHTQLPSPNPLVNNHPG